ncbi:sensor histidine kinase [Asinibacterium sp. OR53]|uniref:tetratricopeptide repeat-containing sensor histidine kinase n=1 Tax=Asinibacterium sp. OR53 TaxID=925409 RepID=UPI000478F16C|nr:sensor histidine kinase [Asinibacterium sp. OR53]
MNLKTASLVLAIALVNGILAQQPAGSDAAIGHAKKVLLQTWIQKDTGGALIALRNTGVAFHLARRYDSAILYFKEGLKLAVSRRQYYLELHDFRPALNNDFFLLGNYTGAMEISVDGLARAEALNNPERIAHFKGVIGYILMKQGKLEVAKQYFIDFLKLADELHDKSLEAKGLFYLADLTILEKNYANAISYIHKAIAVFDDSQVVLNANKNEQLAYADNKLAEVYAQMNDLPHSLQYSLAALHISEQYIRWINRYDLARYYVNGGTIYNRLKQYPQALSLLRKGLSISQELIYMECLQDAYEQLSIAFASLRNYDSAYAYHLRFTQVRDSIVAENNQRVLLEKENRYKMEAQQRLQDAALNRQKLWKDLSIGIACASILIAWLLYKWYSLRQRNHFQAALNMQQQENLRTTIAAADRERKRIADDLHDTLGSLLSATKLKLSAVEETGTMPGQEKENLKEVLVLLDEAMQEMKNIAYNIMPATLSRLGVIAALQSLFNRISHQSVIHINYTTYGFTERLHETVELGIYQVVLEAMNNIVKHAHARNATVQLVRYERHINITIEDDGRGFDAVRENTVGNGLNNMQSRTKNMRGTIDIDSQPGMGTTIIIEIPYT